MRRALASLISLISLAACAAPAGAAAPGRITPVPIGATTGVPVTIATDPVGLSVEYPVLAADFGSGPCPSPALVSAISGLGAPAIRIGGNSEDQTAPAGAPQFAGVTDLPAAFWNQLACLDSHTHEPIVVGLNLASQIPAWAAELAVQARAAVPANLLSFEIGNEPDIDGPSVPWWNATAPAKTLIPFQTYLNDAEAVEQQIEPGATVEGPDFATPRWLSQIPQIASALSLQTIDAHFYPLNACTGSQDATVRALLTPGVSELSHFIGDILTRATALHTPMVISESNSVACRGKAGVSDSAAAAVWGLRLVINVVRGGIQSIRFHSSGSSYDPFLVNADGTITFRPLYYGLETAVRLLPVGATVLSLRTPSDLMGVAVTSPAGVVTYIVTSYASRPVQVQLHTRHAATLVTVEPAVPIVKPQRTVKARAGALSVRIAPNTVVAISPAG